MTQARTVLVVSYHYPPAATPGSRRAATLAIELAARGWNVVVLTATPDAAAGPRTGGLTVVRTTPRRGRAGSGEIARPLASRIPLLKLITGFPDRYAPWGAALGAVLPRLVREYRVDVVLSSSPPHSSQFAIAVTRSFRRFPWVADFRDPWTCPHRRGLSWPSGPIQRHMERFVVRRCDRVLANTPGNRAALLAAMPELSGAGAGKVDVVTNGFDDAMLAAPAAGSAQREGADLTYVGEVYPGMLETYCRALALIREEGGMALPRLAIYGHVSSSERRLVTAAGLDAQFDYRGVVDHEESVEAMRAARRLLVLLPRGDGWRSCVPSKVYWYLAARRPIVAIVPAGDTSALVRETGAGWALDDDNPARVAARLREILNPARSEEEPMATGVERFAMSAIVGHVERILCEVSRGSAS